MRVLTGWREALIRSLRGVLARVPALTALFNQILHHDLAIIGAWHLILRAEIEGDYFEFGVFRGDTFRLSLQTYDRLTKTLGMKKQERKFFAFDSFEGLPASHSNNQQEDNFYHTGEFAAKQGEFLKNIGKYRNRREVQVIPGWFKNTLTDQGKKNLTSKKAAFIVVDCDLYESTKEVLRFCTPLLQTGTLLYFDDWFSIKGSLEMGEARACNEWLKENPHIQLVEYRKCGITGVLFLVQMNLSQNLREKVEPQGRGAA